MHLRGWAIVIAAFLFHHTASAAVLYQPSGTQFPEDQGWLFYGATGTVARSADSTRTAFSTFNPSDSTDATANSTQGGWSNTFPIIHTPVNGSFPSLNRTNGFTLTFGLKVSAESHASTDRAGVSVILLASDHQGIELGFWTNEIWAQSSTFAHAEGTGAYDATVARTYTLSVLNSTYTLNDGSSNILSGSLRDYSASLAVPYGLNNYLFIGDDTTSARGAFELTGMTITVPEPTAAFGFGVLAFLAVGPRRRKPVH
jgi:hypothetical protein